MQPLMFFGILEVDNTVRENKNRNVLLWAALLVGRLDFTISGVCSFRKGHTHDLMDQIFGLLAKAVKNIDEMEDAESVVRLA
jgi:hypothetical protein